MMAQGKIILVVDDEPHMCKILRRILESEGYKVITSLDGETAIRITEEKKPDVILLDIMMPGIDGIEVFRRIREMLPATRVIYFTAKAELDKFKLKELRSSADAFIAKPAASKRILSTISSVL